VGLDDRDRRSFAAVAGHRGLTGRVTAHPFLSDDSFRRLFSGAGVVVFPSDFEGFGLPVLEAMKLGVPVVVGPDAAVAEIAAGHAFTAHDLGPAALAIAVTQALAATEADREAAWRHARGFTWARTAGMTRDSLVRTTAAASTPRSRS
jgi:glycosyltransferase involved in cell wall biosynthesis